MSDWIQSLSSLFFTDTKDHVTSTYQYDDATNTFMPGLSSQCGVLGARSKVFNILDRNHQNPPYKLLLDDTPSHLWLTRCQIFQLMGEKCEAETEGHLAVKFPYQLDIKYCFFDGRFPNYFVKPCLIASWEHMICLFSLFPYSVPTSGFVPKQGVPSLVHHPFPHDLVQTLKKWNQESWDNLFSAYISTPFIPPSSDSDVSTQILAKWLQGLFLSRRLSLPALGTLVPQENPFGKLWPWEKIYTIYIWHLIYVQTDRQTGRQTDRWMDGWIDRWIDR